MRLAFHTWAYASYPTRLPVRSLEDTIDELASLGYDGIEIGGAAPHGYPDYLDAARRAAIRARLEDRRLAPAALCPAQGGAPGLNPASPDELERRAALDYNRALIQLAADLGAPIVVWLAGHRRYRQPKDEAWTHAVENLRASAEAAGEAGVLLAVEPLPADANILIDADDCLRMMDEAGAGPDVAGVLIDTGHLFNRNDEVRDALWLAGDRLVHVHVADLHRDAPGTHRDFTTLVDALREQGYDGWLSLEVGFNRREVDPAEVARAGLEHMRSLLAS
jgi:protein FrlC